MPWKTTVFCPLESVAKGTAVGPLCTQKAR
ncbi:MAG: hypothetical protein AW07_00411 [Candidatus Accumulibacter sp. SK-11]|nr:MAG: hypothetical protein AW07_00411 [Candidatus Accumulibacter sp. SK-11]